jgi:hypothetical protein
LLITGPVDHDEHWRTLSREADLKVDGASEPLVYRSATIQLSDRTLALSYSLPAQSWLDSLRFAGGATLKEIPYGKGKVFWAAYPVELADGLQPATELYSYVAGRIGIKPAFELQSSVSPGVLIYPTVLQDSVMYILASDSADDEQIDLRDNLTGAHLSLRLPSQHAAIALIGQQSKQIIVKYGF